MERLNSFYNWYKNLGGNVVQSDYLTISRLLNEPLLRISSLKQRSKEVKDMYNYKFV